MYVSHNTEARSRNHCCRGKTISTKYYECVSAFWPYPACNAHAPYCHLWPVRLYNIFPHYLTNGPIFAKKKVIQREPCVQIFSTTFVCNIYYFKLKIRGNVTINVRVSSPTVPAILVTLRYNTCMCVFTYSTRYSCHIIIKFEFH
jgi:hypothetical protein